MGPGFFVFGVGWRNRPAGPTACCARLRDSSMFSDDGGGDAGLDAEPAVARPGSLCVSLADAFH